MFDLPYAQGDANGYPTIAARSVQIAARRPMLSHIGTLTSSASGEVPCV